MEGHWKFLGGRGVLKANFLEAMKQCMKINWNLLGGGGGAKEKTFRRGSMDIFWNCTLLYRGIIKNESLI